MKTFTHNVPVPQLTDVQQLLGMYQGLFTALGISHEMNFPLVEQFTHPIQSENDKLVNDFFNTMMTMKQVVLNKTNIKVSNIVVNQVMLTIIISFEEP